MSDPTREQFEKWATEYLGDFWLQRTEGDGSYNWRKTETGWQAWQAAIAAFPRHFYLWYGMFTQIEKYRGEKRRWLR